MTLIGCINDAKVAGGSAIEQRLYPARALHGQVAHTIGRRIASGEIREGALLPREAELALQFNISRQAVREALKVLAAKGLVISRRRTGTRVQPRSAWNLLDPDVLAWHPLDQLDPAFIRDLMELRRVVEPSAAEFAALRAKPEQVAEIRRALDAMRDSIDDVEAFVIHDTAFHIALVGASRNVLFERLSVIVAPLLHASLALQGKIRTRDWAINEALPRHVALYEAIAARNPGAARAAAEDLLYYAGREVAAIPFRATDDSAALPNAANG
jgi:DNA-binding FadR family transcriptional regulator